MSTVHQLPLPLRKADPVLDRVDRERRAINIWLSERAHSDRPSRVVNLRTGEQCIYTLRPMDAVICAYAQERGDWFTPLYRHRYLRETRVGRWHIVAGDWATRL